MTAPSLFDLSDRVAVVTGGAGLLGREHARALASAGARVAIVDIDREEAECAAAAVAGWTGGEVIGLPVNVTDPDSLRMLDRAVIALYGRIDVLINNAAINDRFESPELAAEQSRFESYPVAQWRRVMEVNVTGTFLAAQVMGPRMVEQGRGSIINIASTYGIVAPDPSLYERPDGARPFMKSPSYPASKGAVISFTRYLAAYWGSTGVRVNALAPGGVENGQEPWFVHNYARRTPLGRMAAPDDYRGAVVFLASDASSYMTGATLVVDGGYSVW